MTGAQITVVVTVLSALAAVLTAVWRAGQTVAELRAAIKSINEALAQLVRIDVDHEDRMRELERETWSSAPRRRQRDRDDRPRHGTGG